MSHLRLSRIAEAICLFRYLELSNCVGCQYKLFWCVFRYFIIGVGGTCKLYFRDNDKGYDLYVKGEDRGEKRKFAR